MTHLKDRLNLIIEGKCLAVSDKGHDTDSHHPSQIAGEALAYITKIEKLLGDARFAIEATLVCLNTWNGGRGSFANCEGIMARIDKVLQK